jgi:hypothetical protein
MNKLLTMQFTGQAVDNLLLEVYNQHINYKQFIPCNRLTAGWKEQSLPRESERRDKFNFI